jgi:hypothetical protein
MESLETRRRVAELASELYTGRISYQDFIDSVPESADDEQIEELIDLIEHEPKVGGLFNPFTEQKHRQYLKRIRN